MSKLLFRAESEGNSILTLNIIFGIVFLITIVGIPMAIYFFVTASKYSKCKLEVYEDHIEGTAIFNGLVTSAHFKTEKIESVRVESGGLQVSLAAGATSYLFVMSGENARKAEATINKLIRG